MCRKILKVAVCLVFAAAWACNGLVIIKDPDGQLLVSVEVEVPGGVRTKSLDVDSYMFLIKNSMGDTLFSSTVEEIKDTSLPLEQGAYTVIAYNRSFTSPAFEEPYFYAMETVEVISGEACKVHLICTQHNAGVRVLFSESFKEDYPDGFMSISEGTEELVYNDNTENRWGYFHPGDVVLKLYSDTDDPEIAQRTLHASYMYTFLVEQPGDVSVEIEASFSIAVDTTRTHEQTVWNHFEEQGGEGLTKETACTVAQARQLPTGTKDVWVCGYIVGCYKSSGGAFLPGTDAEVDTNLALADNPGEQIKENTYSIELPSGARRDTLNLKDNPTNLDKKVWLKGTTHHNYMGIPGLKSLKEFSW
ncbi:MAG: DUF4493 domain-containing protein [Bacteroidales bacterium]|nr:DUF4493 domain-containing protein [Bacteroidales bacterium]